MFCLLSVLVQSGFFDILLHFGLYNIHIQLYDLLTVHDYGLNRNTTI